MPKILLEEVDVEVGNIKYIINHKTRRLNMTVKGSYVRISIPRKSNIDEARNFLYRNKKWVLKQKRSIEESIKKAENAINLFTQEEIIYKKSQLIERLKELSNQHKLPFNKVIIKNQKTLWGSCSAKNNINLNINLLYIPKEIVDYVLIHELIHTKIKNHSKKFWENLELIVPNYKTLRKSISDHQYLLSL